jgi:hypothetical protein
VPSYTWSTAHPEETRAALWLASAHPRERETAVARWFRATLPLRDDEGRALVDAAMRLDDAHALDPRWEAVLHGYLAARG